MRDKPTTFLFVRLFVCACVLNIRTYKASWSYSLICLAIHSLYINMNMNMNINIDINIDIDIDVVCIPRPVD